MSKTEQQLRLTTGRLLAYDEHGAVDGTPIFYFHGSPSTRLEWHLFGSDTLARKLKVRVIVPDRPGLGRSEFQPGRRISDWPADVIALADRLAIARFAVLGYSGGGPYAAVCALKIPERLTHVGIVSGTGPFDEPGLSAAINPVNLRFIQLARTNPWLSRTDAAADGSHGAVLATPFHCTSYGEVPCLRPVGVDPTGFPAR